MTMKVVDNATISGCLLCQHHEGAVIKLFLKGIARVKPLSSSGSTSCLIVVIVIGSLYALPNLFGEDPAVQITGARARCSEQTLIQVQKTLQEEKNNWLSRWHWNRRYLARFDSTDTQLRAREALMGVMGDKYVVALTLPRQRRAGWQRSTLSR